VRLGRLFGAQQSGTGDTWRQKKADLVDGYVSASVRQGPEGLHRPGFDPMLWPGLDPMLYPGLDAGFYPV